MNYLCYLVIPSVPLRHPIETIRPSQLKWQLSRQYFQSRFCPLLQCRSRTRPFVPRPRQFQATLKLVPPQSAVESPVLQIEAPSITFQVPASAPSPAPTVMPTPVSKSPFPIEAPLATPARAPSQAPMVMPSQVPILYVPIEAHASPSVPLPAVPPCSDRDPVAASWKPELVGSKQDELRQLVARSTQQFESS
jgi:hypothetical protein